MIRSPKFVIFSGKICVGYRLYVKNVSGARSSASVNQVGLRAESFHISPVKKVFSVLRILDRYPALIPSGRYLDYLDDTSVLSFMILKFHRDNICGTSSIETQHRPLILSSLISRSTQSPSVQLCGQLRVYGACLLIRRITETRA